MRAIFFIMALLILLFGAFTFGTVFPEYAERILPKNMHAKLKEPLKSTLNVTDEQPKIITPQILPEKLEENAQSADTSINEPTPENKQPEVKEKDRNLISTDDNLSDEDENIQEEIIKGNIAKGDTLMKIFLPWSSENIISKYLTEINKILSLTNFKAGHEYIIHRDLQKGEMTKFEYEIDDKNRLIVEGDSENVKAKIYTIQYDVVLTRIDGEVKSSFFQSVIDKGEKPSLALLLSEIFGWEINFIRDVQSGDTFSVLLEKFYKNGIFKGYGKVLGASFTNNGKKYEAFLFKDIAGTYRHFNLKGENLRKTLLQAPLAFNKVTSSFSLARRHPIMGGLKPHLGVDYAAPTGTPIKAVGDGRIVQEGYSGGYGRQLVVKHAVGLESMYSHLSKYAKGIKKGSIVRQGQVIAFVGSSGMATGPHLDFRIKQNGKFINPQKVVNPRSTAITNIKRKEFNEQVVKIRAYMNGEKNLVDYTSGIF